MKMQWLTVTLVALSFACPSWQVRAQETKDITIDGQVKIGVHKFKLDSSSVYQFEVKGKNFSPVVNLPGSPLANSADFFKERNTFRGTFFPKKTQEYTLTVSPGFGIGAQPADGLFDYTVTLKVMKLDETPILKKVDKLTADDAKIQHKEIFRKTGFKAYTIKMKAGETYIIDMVAAKEAGNSLDPYLYLENPKKNIVAADDDGGGFPDARIIYLAPSDGEFRILASGLSERSDVGDYTLTVRTLKEAK